MLKDVIERYTSIIENRYFADEACHQQNTSNLRTNIKVNILYKITDLVMESYINEMYVPFRSF